ncbi:hypothetical protein FB45DRAFT_921374 [Roridomyces roridus]|uniref:Uncharacterized protein n=1 Tax=Roridomyces roridus TaxID=1738132 RepID=A0AAD7BQY5_9AGAR|nr:hypothetical protein FB45DRAFT_921374 [Roridomyces roridus]
MATSKKRSCAYTLPTGGSARAFFSIHTDALRTPSTVVGALGDIYISSTDPPSVFVRYATQWRGPLSRMARSGMTHPKYPELVLSDGNARKTTWVPKQAAVGAGMKRKVEDEEEGRPAKKVKCEAQVEARSPPLPRAPVSPVQPEPVSPTDPAPQNTPPDTDRSFPAPPSPPPPLPDALTTISTAGESIPVQTEPEPGASVTHTKTTQTTTPVPDDPPPLTDAQPRIPTLDATIPVLPQPRAEAPVVVEMNRETTRATAPVTLGWIRCSTGAMPNVPSPSALPSLLNIPNIAAGIFPNPTSHGPRARLLRDFASAPVVVRNFWSSSAGARQSWEAPKPGLVPGPPPATPHPFHLPRHEQWVMRSVNSNSAASQELRSSTARVEPTPPPPRMVAEPPISGPWPAYQDPWLPSVPNANANVPPPSSSSYRPRLSITPARICSRTGPPAPRAEPATSPRPDLDHFEDLWVGSAGVEPSASPAPNPTHSASVDHDAHVRGETRTTLGAVGSSADAGKLDFTPMRNFSSDSSTRMASASSVSPGNAVSRGGVESSAASPRRPPTEISTAVLMASTSRVSLSGTVDKGKQKQTEETVVIDLTDSPDLPPAPLPATKQPIPEASSSRRLAEPDTLWRPKSLAEIPITRSHHVPDNSVLVNRLKTMESNHNHVKFAGLLLLQERNTFAQQRDQLLQERSTLARHRDQLFAEKEQLGKDYRALYAKYQLLDGLVTSAPILTLIEQNSRLRARGEVLEAENVGLRKENEGLRARNADLATAGLEGMSGTLDRSALEREVLKERSAKEALKAIAMELQKKNAGLQALKGELERRLAERAGSTTNSHASSQAASPAKPPSRNSGSLQDPSPFVCPPGPSLIGDADKFTLGGATFTASSLIAIVEQKGGGSTLGNNAWGQILAQLQVLAPKETPLQLRGWKDMIGALKEYYMRDLVGKESPVGSFVPGKIVSPACQDVSVVQVSQAAKGPTRRPVEDTIAETAAVSRSDKHTLLQPNRETALTPTGLSDSTASTSSGGRLASTHPKPDENAVIATDRTDEDPVITTDGTNDTDVEEVEVVQAELLPEPLENVTVPPKNEPIEVQLTWDSTHSEFRLRQSHLDILWTKDKLMFSCMACATVNVTYSLPRTTDPAELCAHSEGEHGDLCDVIVGQTVGMGDEEVGEWFARLDG